MAQTIKSKIRKLADIYNIDTVIQMALEVREDINDTLAWNSMTDDARTAWFLAQCQKYNLTTQIDPYQITIKELPCGHSAYFTVFFTRDNGVDHWHLEIGGSYVGNLNGGIWPTHPGLKGKERQIAEVMRLHEKGE